MIAADLVSESIIPLKTSDSGEEALATMNQFLLRHLPIVNNEQFLGLISEDDILNHDINEPIGSYGLSLSQAYVRKNDHIYEVMRLLGDYHLTVIPVVDENGNYVGLILQEDLLRYFAHAGSFTEPGSILVLEIKKRDYSLAEIARIVESENAAILSTFITTGLDTEIVEVTLKINRQDLQHISATFQRFDYKVKAAFQESSFEDALKDRYDSLMTFLNV